MTLSKSRAAILTITVAIACTFLPARAQAQPTLHREHTSAAITYPYSPAEARGYWQALHPARPIDGPTAAIFAGFLNEITRQRLVAYLQAVAAAYAAAIAPRSCTGGESCAALIRSVFSSRGLDGEAAVRVARCESSLSPTATNGSYDGLFQQGRRYWAERSARYGVSGRSIYDGEANAIVSAGMVRDDGGWRAWSCQP